MPLKVDAIAAEILIGSAEKMIQANVIKSSCGLEAGNMAAHTRGFFVGTQYRHDCIPANQCTNLALHRWVARQLLLQMSRDGINVASSGVVRQIGTRTSRLINHGFEQEMGTFGAFIFQD